MAELFKGIGRAGILGAGVTCILFLVLGGCRPQTKLFTIGMVNDVSVREPAFDGFKAGMAKLGYVEGENVKYIYNGATGIEEKVIDAEIKKMLSQNIDLILALGNTVAFRAKEILEGTNIPIVAVAVGAPVESGLVDSLGHPGGNLTGLQIFDANLKGLEWLKMVVPEARKVYLPYDAADSHSKIIMEDLVKSAFQMGIGLIIQAVHTADEAAAAIDNLPEDIDAVYRTSAPGIDPENYKISQAAIRRCLPIVAATSLDEDVLLTCGTSVYEMGRQTARLADQIRQGVKPADVPVEMAEVYITINLKTAEKIGLHIPTSVLMSAKNVIR
ncbi:MAG: ABC transporter substrate-binding protein [Deltaproteobacteria bacterium]|nr:ABC transporter substrate-binding protein [Deltaproteobacteria bacterium]